jgi:hypothetical protein
MSASTLGGKLAAACSLLAATGCASSGTVRQAGAPDRPADDARLAVPRDVLTAAEIQGAPVSTTVDAVRLLRPEFLVPADRPSIASGVLPLPAVYIDDAHVGGPEELRTIPLAIVDQIRFLRPARARDRWGAYCPCAGGVIQVRTRRERG